jgi:two-component system, OmpR family, phosphate regulon response regulator PhoB
MTLRALRTRPHAARHHPTVRSVVFRFEDITAFSVALGEAQGALALPAGESVTDGEWVLAIFEIGSRRRATAAAARGVRAAGDTHIEFERRDWDRLTAFVAARSEHMRVARPVAESALAPARRASGAGGHEREPAAKREGEGEGELSASGEHEAPPSSALESTRIPFAARVLLIDDDARTRAEVRKMLTEIGLVVDTVDDAEQANARMTEVTFDALVLDLHLQTESPLDFVRDLRGDPQRTPVPVLVLSHRPSSRDVVDAFASGADDFLPKPFRAPELGARVFGMLRRARLARAGSVAPGSFGPRSTRGGGSPP